MRQALVCGGSGEVGLWVECYPLWRARIIKINELTFTCKSIWPQKRNKCTTCLSICIRMVCWGVGRVVHPPYVHIHLITGVSPTTPSWPALAMANLLFMRVFLPLVFPRFFLFTHFSCFSHPFRLLSGIKALRFIHQWLAEWVLAGALPMQNHFYYKFNHPKQFAPTANWFISVPFNWLLTD